MMMWVEKFDNLKLNFNYVPVLLDSLIDYENGAHDIHSRITVTPVEQLSQEDKIFIINNFFDANYQTMILQNEQYHNLYKKYQQNIESTDIFTEQEYSDLMALFNLAWIDPSFKNSDERLKRLVQKGKDYTLEDRIEIIEIQREIIRQIIPKLKKLVAENKIEVSTSPYYHPIVPILIDYKAIRNDNSDTDELSELHTEEDAKIQTKMALDRIEKLIGKRPKGIWASEQCVSPNTLEMLSDLGVEWSISDEGNLARSIDFEFVHDFKGYLEDPYHLLKTYSYKTRNSDIKMIFRESTIYNLVSFEYANHNPVATANDLYDRIKVMQGKILSSPDQDHLLTIAMDGENCWENYIDDGNTFLQTLYELISKDDSLETVLISDYIEQTKEHKKLNKVNTK
jgi:alpha-amylase/alpha-mannosidase (GH57 family)